MASWHGLDVCLGTSGLLRKRCASSANRHLRLVHNVCQTHRAAGEIRQKRTSAYKRDGLHHAAERFAGTGALTASCCISHLTRTVPNTPKLTYSQWQIFDRMRIGVLTSTGRSFAANLPRNSQEERPDANGVARACTRTYYYVRHRHCCRKASCGVTPPFPFRFSSRGRSRRFRVR